MWKQSAAAPLYSLILFRAPLTDQKSREYVM